MTPIKHNGDNQFQKCGFALDQTRMKLKETNLRNISAASNMATCKDTQWDRCRSDASWLAAGNSSECDMLGWDLVFLVLARTCWYRATYVVHDDMGHFKIVKNLLLLIFNTMNTQKQTTNWLCSIPFCRGHEGLFHAGWVDDMLSADNCAVQ